MTREYYFETFKKNTHRMTVEVNGEIVDVLEQENPNKGDLPKLTLFGLYTRHAELSFDDSNIDRFLFCNDNPGLNQ